MTAAADCPRCGRGPIEMANPGQARRSYIPSCACYPHPPQCVSCRRPILGERCPNVNCYVFDVLQPCPDTDPLWEQVAP